MEERQDRFGVSAAVLKWIAVVTMVIDHFAAAVYWQMADSSYDVYFVMRKVGRIAFPIYCFLLVEGFLSYQECGEVSAKLFSVRTVVRDPV